MVIGSGAILVPVFGGLHPDLVLVLSTSHMGQELRSSLGNITQVTLKKKNMYISNKKLGAHRVNWVLSHSLIWLEAPHTKLLSMLCQVVSGLEVHSAELTGVAVNKV